VDFSVGSFSIGISADNPAQKNFNFISKGDSKRMKIDVEEMLKSYNKLRQEAGQLEFEINNYIPAATDTDVIEAMTFSKPQGDEISGIHSGKTSDKTSAIAASYPDQARNINLRHKQALESDLRQVNVQIMRLEHYINLLGGNHTKVLQLIYINELTYDKTASEIKVSVTTVKKLRLEALEKLTVMFQAVTH
jgi:DNA-directed RNA polymerase specialized sigma subunit